MPVFSLGLKLKALFSKGESLEDFYDDLEDILIESDIGVKTSLELITILKDKKIKAKDEFGVLKELRDIISGYIKTWDMELESDKLNVFLVLGVNGVGKTTTIAKLASYYKKKNSVDSVLAAGDTFRAAAIDQLVFHGDKLGMKVVKQKPGADPGAVIYDSIANAKAGGKELVIADTAGRMHNKANLVRELQKIDKIVTTKAGEVNYRKVIVIDATTGQNGLRQVEIFHEAVGIDGVILAKYDSMSKGGIVVPVSRELGIPVAFIGIGEKYEDLIPFNKENYLNNLLDID